MAETTRATSFSFHAQLNTPSFDLRFHIFCAFPSYISRQFSEAFSTLICSLFYFIQLQLISSFNQSMAFIIPLLINFLQLKYQGNDLTPFSTHPRTMLVAVSSSAVYCLANIALLRFPLRRRFAHHYLVWSAYASVASLASVLFPDSLSPFVYTIFVFLPAAELLYLLYHKLVVDQGAEFQVQRRGIRGQFLNADIWRVAGSSSGQWPQTRPPV